MRKHKSRDTVGCCLTSGRGKAAHCVPAGACATHWLPHSDQVAVYAGAEPKDDAPSTFNDPAEAEASKELVRARFQRSSRVPAPSVA